MGVRNNMSTRKLTGRQLREFRSDVAKLKAKGLVSKNKDARSQAPTRYMQNQVAKYRDVLAGKAQVVKVASRKEAKEYDTLFRTKGKAVVLPVSAKGERVRYNPRTHEITSTYSRGEQRITRHWPKQPLAGTPHGSLPQGGNVLYTIPFQGRGVYRTNDLTDLYNMMRDLIASGWENVRQYVIVETIQNGRASLSGL